MTIEREEFQSFRTEMRDDIKDLKADLRLFAQEMRSSHAQLSIDVGNAHSTLGVHATKITALENPANDNKCLTRREAKLWSGGVIALAAAIRWWKGGGW